MRLMGICVVILSLLIGFFSVRESIAENLRVMLHEGSLPPYYYKDGDPRTGIVKDVFNAFAKETGDTIEFVRCPFNRSQRKFDRGEIDIEPMSNPAWRQTAKVLGVFSKPFAVSDSIILFRAEKFIPDVTPQDLLGKSIGVVRGYHYPVYSAYFADGRINTHVLENENKLLQLLLAGRLDQAFMNKDTALYQIRELGVEDQLLVGKTYDSLDMMIRFQPSKQYVLPRFNKAIDKLLNDGTITKIYDKYR
ncbi:substrate-binding periplasmic protein [Maridesulfovibrio salexigens]|uniref:Extracellular solute-binding protein family 3 n=1 Tax=Maridesulfovibrio salexigens (strain ATCC 14822 / DSM 2638 / NCIMB 8403 / VKM B-1763) TaxID=526222 RepID=C6BXZ8_MARSD|nr:transporter substrate-binding domain-containing protein [Maridesulfovibrio salexigens]ACS80528.1 extracellular solute-binding protein family 3 [Maridesulfovibrio salexigens DSM 2638]